MPHNDSRKPWTGPWTNRAAAARRVIASEKLTLHGPWHTGDVAHHSTKQILKQLIDELPDDATIADVQYRLYIIDAVNRGRDEIASGSGIPHAQVANELRAKWSRGNER